MPKLLYYALCISLTTLLACSSTETSSSPTAVAQTQAPAPSAASIPAPTAAPVETPEQAESPTTAPVEIPTPTSSPVEIPAPTDAPPKMLNPINMKDPEAFMSHLSKDEQSCLSETGDPQQLTALMDNRQLASQQERDALAKCLEHETLLNIFLKGFTDQTGPLSSDTSACVSEGFQNFNLHAMMLTNPEGPGTQAAIVKDMAGILITLSCLNEDEWKATSPALDLKPEGRETLQCVMNKLGGPKGIVASIESKGESKEGEPPLPLLHAAAECGLTTMVGPPG